MSNRDSTNDLYDGDEDDGYEDYDDDAFLDEDEPSDLISCPACGSDIYEDAEQCPICGEYVVHHSSLWSDRPVWWVVLGLLGIVCTIWALSGM